jgi:hypothetical protein
MILGFIYVYLKQFLHIVRILDMLGPMERPKASREEGAVAHANSLARGATATPSAARAVASAADLTWERYQEQAAIAYRRRRPDHPPRVSGRRRSTSPRSTSGAATPGWPGEKDRTPSELGKAGTHRLHSDQEQRRGRRGSIGASSWPRVPEPSLGEAENSARRVRKHGTIPGSGRNSVQGAGYGIDLHIG